MWRNDIYCKYNFMFLLINLACKELNLMPYGSMSHTLHVCLPSNDMHTFQRPQCPGAPNVDYCCILDINITHCTIFLSRYVHFHIKFSSHRRKSYWWYWYSLTHWGQNTHICFNDITIIGSDNGLSPGQCQAITWTNVRILLIGPLGTNFSEMLIEIHTFLFKKVNLKMLSGKWGPFCLDLNVLTKSYQISPERYGVYFVSIVVKNVLWKIQCFIDWNPLQLDYSLETNHLRPVADLVIRQLLLLHI